MSPFWSTGKVLKSTVCCHSLDCPPSALIVNEQLPNLYLAYWRRRRRRKRRRRRRRRRKKKEVVRFK